MVATTTELDIPVQFGGVSIGQATARLGIKIERKLMRIGRADKTFCGRRLTGRVQLGGNEDSPEQTTMFETDAYIDATFDVHRFSVDEDKYSTGLTFKLKEIDVGLLAKFSKGSGRLIIDEVVDIPADVVEEKPAAEHLPGQFKAEGPWRKVSVDELFSGAILKSLKSAGIETVGDLSDFTKPEKNGHIKQLADIKGIGGSKVAKIDEIMLQFWSDNPEAR